MEDVKLLIAGRDTPAAKSATFDRLNPRYGRFGGKAGVNEFTGLRWITIQTTPRHYPF
jgi:hypothetical protein